MAKPFKKNGSWAVRVQIHGKRRSKTFPTKAQAENWAAQQRVNAHNDSLGVIAPREMRELFARYNKEVSGKKDSNKESIRLERFMKEDIADIYSTKITATDIYNWSQDRLEDVTPATVNREWNLLSAVCTRAVKQWKWLSHNPCSDAQRPEKGKPRTRRPTNDEMTKVLKALGWSESLPETAGQKTAAAALFAIETAMRAGEICNLEHHEVFDKKVHIPEHKAKNRTARDVPLTKRAREIISLLPKDGDFVFDLNNGTRDVTWRNATKAAMVEDLHFHDLRREALSRLAKKVDVMTLAKISGHKDLKMLLNVYYSPKMDEVADLIG